MGPRVQKGSSSPWEEIKQLVLKMQQGCEEMQLTTQKLISELGFLRDNLSSEVMVEESMKSITTEPVHQIGEDNDVTKDSRDVVSRTSLPVVPFFSRNFNSQERTVVNEQNYGSQDSLSLTKEEYTPKVFDKMPEWCLQNSPNEKPFKSCSVGNDDLKIDNGEVDDKGLVVEASMWQSGNSGEPNEGVSIQPEKIKMIYPKLLYDKSNLYKVLHEEDTISKRTEIAYPVTQNTEQQSFSDINAERAIWYELLFIMNKGCLNMKRYLWFKWKHKVLTGVGLLKPCSKLLVLVENKSYGKLVLEYKKEFVEDMWFIANCLSVATIMEGSPSAERKTIKLLKDKNRWWFLNVFGSCEKKVWLFDLWSCKVKISQFAFDTFD